MFKHAIVRKPCKAMVKGLTAAKLGTPDYALALQQHQDYIVALRECGLQVTELAPLEDYPDSCFVEDVALITPQGAILTHPGAPSRRGEVDFIEAAIKQFFPYPDYIDAPGHVEAGDIMMVGGHFYIGLSARTNRQGAEQMISILSKHGLSGSVVKMSDLLHLKTGLSYLENNNLLTFGEMHHHPDFSDYHRIEISAEESYAANSVWINGTVLVPKGFPLALAAIQALGYQTREVAMSEFQKLDGGLSCLSLRF
ncbi:dimethylarginine dimethylaminohydrolase family protein [Paraglaciecola hydrolytica]|uniref:N(G),N(G)-dimethylarginine dimethylaminohydrolase n=1 Tax=Paraglaciecola hydrolytica TaxID=1799789 RepID=A0A136A3X0_9ALTE|nr:arginine deiminase family protein [Paraglaciecola hydrolytica]KXI29938.1 N(G),N(G)-dimethylarginine dimethylaminohydrolase [Paraglaciecola hydrolytica]